VAWLSAWVWVLGLTPMVNFGLLLFPDDRLPSARWRPLAWLAAAAVAAALLVDRGGDRHPQAPLVRHRSSYQSLAGVRRAERLPGQGRRTDRHRTGRPVGGQRRRHLRSRHRRTRAAFSPPPAPSAQPPAFPALTDREREALELVARGEGNATIAHKVAVSQKTVRNHVSNIFLKLHVADRAQAIVRARQAGFGQLIPGSDPP
jgi:ATP/maltotriose-dependent transcriptional regulator MalT